MEVLAHLATRPGEVVSAEELIEAVWRGRAVGDGAVYKTIHLLRDALGDDRGDVRYIQTIPKRGYRLLAPVTILEPESGAEVAVAVAIGKRLRLSIAGVLVSTLAVGFLIFDPFGPDPNRSVAVLPFKSLSTSADDAIFSAGIHSDVLAHLAKISALRVISRTSVMEYEDSLKSLRQIGDELGVSTILEGTVQRSGDFVRINVQLVNVETDENLWTEVYDRELTTQNIFAIQSEMATSISAALQATLSPEEVARLYEVPTESTRAWNYYLSGNDYLRSDDEEAHVPLAVELFGRAVEVDPQFALAWAGLARGHTGAYFFGFDETESRRELAREAVDRALDLAPALPEAHLALGYYYGQVLRDYERALQEYAIAALGMPGSSELYLLRAFSHRRLGEWEQAIANFERAVELDPRNNEQRTELARTYYLRRNYTQAEINFDRALEIKPDDVQAYAHKVQLSLWRDGDVTSIKAAVEDPPMELGDLRERLGWIAAVYERDYETALSYLNDGEVDIYMGNHQYIPNESYLGVTYQLAGYPELAEPHFQVVRELLEEAFEANSDDDRLHITLAEALVGLGESEEAIRLAHRAIELSPASTDVIAGGEVQIDAIIRVLAPAGAAAAAIEELDAYLSTPGPWSIEGLLPDPRFDPIRDDPRFEALVEKYKRN